MKEETREWIRSRAEVIGVVSMVLAAVVMAFVATLYFPTAGQTVMKAGAAVLVLAFGAFYARARFPIASRKYSTIGTSTLTISEQLKRTRALLQRVLLLILIAWCVGVTLLVPNLTAAKRYGFVIVGAWVLVYGHSRDRGVLGCVPALRGKF